MEIGDVIKMLMRDRKVSQKTMGDRFGKGQAAISTCLLETPLAVSERIAMLEFLGYEVIVREKRPGRRADGEIVVTAGGDGEKAETPAARETEEKPKKKKAKEKDEEPSAEEIVRAMVRLLKEQKELCDGE